MIDDFEGKIIAEKYRIESILRDSDLGTIYRAWHVLMDKPVTVKILSPALAMDKRFVERFLSEAKTLSQAAHPNILNVTDFGTDEKNITYAVFEDAAGATLKNLVEQDGTLPISRALNIAKQTAAGVAAAHAKNLTHGGLSPEKILVSNEDGNEKVKVFDFGTQPAGWNSNADIEYLSPEQYADTANGDARSDIYSLGAVLYEMLAGAAPFVGKTTKELKAKQDSEPPPPLSAFRSDLPADLEPMILSAISAVPEKRYQSMRSFAEDLELLSGGVPAAQKAAAAPRRNLWQTAFIVLIGISLLAAALIYATSVRKTDPTTTLEAQAGSLPVQPIGPATGIQEDNLAKLPAMTEAELMAAQNSNTTLPIDTLPGGDGYNAWSNGGAPPLGAPPPQYIPPTDQRLSGDPNPGSQFMSPETGTGTATNPGDTILYTKDPSGRCLRLPSYEPMPCPGSGVEPRQSPTPKKPPANTTQSIPAPASSPKPLATPPTTDKPAADPNKGKPAATPKPKSGKKTDS